MPPQIHQHSSPQTTLAPHLQKLLPHALPLLRRLQFHFQSPHAHTFATFAPNSAPADGELWTAAYVDRSRAPETECWVFNSSEARAVNAASNDENDEGRLQVLALLRAIRQDQDQDQDQSSGLKSEAKLVIGAVHESTLSLLQPVVHWVSEAWLTVFYNIPTSTFPLSGDDDGNKKKEKALLDSLGLNWSTVQPEEFSLVRSRTEIPRRDRTLVLLPSVGVRDVRDDGRLMGWAFIGVDGSLASLHVEPELRGKGLGRVIAARTLRLLAEGDGFAGVKDEAEDGWVWGYSHASTVNQGSIAVAKALGGQQASWKEYWISVDLAKL